jgi:hypothetical protein
MNIQSLTLQSVHLKEVILLNRGGPLFSGGSHFTITTNPFLFITVENLSYLSYVIKIWIFEFSVQAISDRSLDTFKSSKGQIKPKVLRGEENEVALKWATAFNCLISQAVIYLLL